ncbi:helix-turn-helix domain-containing protein [Ornithinibacillus massiliensis]|uniref:Helix-turn-helix domain-containing protein n=1 Tax=Ornithinibacillus massiliensis TaxID=1944633 RepID=A0ABS5MAL2_9BACI|nr:sugar diacid recognition domain-containing protein [Ornithinibacillus massiliensis]MBS3679361.1 helix-turn-helix domain-containing protein [Ornithinibacillus massiliensis]
MSELFHTGRFYSRVVQEVQRLINEDVILTDQDGIIVASSDPSRINDFHEGALLAMQTKQNMFMTEELTSTLKGVRKGVVLPIIIEEKPIGCIGITGEPKVVQPFAMLVQKVAELFVQDSIIQANEERQARELEFFVFDWINSKEVTKSLLERSRFFSIHMSKYERVLVLKNNLSTLQFSYKDINLLHTVWDQDGDTLFIRWGQDKLLMLLTDKFNQNILQQKLVNFIRDMEKTLKIEMVVGVGQVTSYEQLYLSFEQADRACEAASNEKPIVFEEELRFDILQQALDDVTKNNFIKRTIEPLKSEVILLQTLTSWFRNDMSNQVTAKELHIHKNTLLYRLKRIEELTGLKTSKIHHLVILYIGYRFLSE